MTSPSVQWHDRVGSTNDVARELIMAGRHDVTVVAARRQTAGRGRRGADWLCLDGAHVMMSVIHRSSLDVAAVAPMTLDVGVAVAGALRERCGLSVMLKWPNDLVVLRGDGSWRKLGGILCELAEVTPCAVVAGVGVNVNAAAGSFPDSVRSLATSVQAETGEEMDVEGLVEALGAAVVLACEAFDRRGGPDVTAYSGLCSTLGRRVARAGAEDVAGLAQGIAADGALRVLWDGHSEVESVAAGAIIHI